ncbi:hypothetical protein KKF91_09595 [Myxococcota bacterium]|nr:hypothetical protein [Myxococcota bacterium]MBU1430795.1 hypothetical protein [Myxococcota bacterium]MBU1900121.1 hypothetical protein [Myxococcota bacterium]
MPLWVKHKATMRASLEKRYGPDVVIVDVTSKGPEPWRRFSPFYPHGGIPVPRSEGYTSQSVEGLWQALKVFESVDVDLSKLEIASMRGLKRTTRRLGRVLGHRDGVEGAGLLAYLPARRALYLPSYLWVLTHRLQEEVAALRDLCAAHEIVVLQDYNTNPDPDDPAKPLSHAALIKRYIEGDWPA